MPISLDSIRKVAVKEVKKKPTDRTFFERSTGSTGRQQQQQQQNFQSSRNEPNPFHIQRSELAGAANGRACQHQTLHTPSPRHESGETGPAIFRHQHQCPFHHCSQCTTMSQCCCVFVQMGGAEAGHAMPWVFLQQLTRTTYGPVNPIISVENAIGMRSGVPHSAWRGNDSDGNTLNTYSTHGHGSTAPQTRSDESTA